MESIRMPEGLAGVRSFGFITPVIPVTFPAMERVPAVILKASFPEIATMGVDTSVTRACRMLTGIPFLRFEDTKKQRRNGREEKTLVQHIDDYLVRQKLVYLGVHHAFKLCAGQSTIRFLRLPGILRIWFYGFCAYEAYHELTPASLAVKATGTGGGELRPVMERDAMGSPWRVRMLPSYVYSHHEDCVAFAQII